MKLKIKSHPNSSREKIDKISDDKIEVWIKEKPIGGKANVALEKFLKKYFNKPVRVVKGFKSKNKVVEI